MDKQVEQKTVTDGDRTAADELLVWCFEVQDQPKYREKFNSVISAYRQRTVAEAVAGKDKEIERLRAELERRKDDSGTSGTRDLWNVLDQQASLSSLRQEIAQLRATLAEREREIERLAAALEEIATHPVRNEVVGRSDLGIPGHRPCQDVADEALAKWRALETPPAP